jgi:hypothetical protein
VVIKTAQNTCSEGPIKIGAGLAVRFELLVHRLWRRQFRGRQDNQCGDAEAECYGKTDGAKRQNICRQRGPSFLTIPKNLQQCKDKYKEIIKPISPMGPGSWFLKMPETLM